MIKRLSSDLHAEFPEMKGLSPRNIQYMTTFAGAWQDGPIAQRAVAQLPWTRVQTPSTWRGHLLSVSSMIS